MSKLFAMPDFLTGRINQTTYTRWVHRKAASHVKRDRLRCSYPIAGSDYRRLIHAAVCTSGGRDHYTGEELRWELLSTYCNDTSKAERSAYKASMALLPTVDHVPGADDRYDFVICAWRTNDAKNDLSHDEFLALCRRVISHHDEQHGSDPATR